MFDQLAQQTAQGANPFQRKSADAYAKAPQQAKQAALGAAIGGRQMPMAQRPSPAPSGPPVDASAAGALQQPAVGAPPPNPGSSVPLGPGTLAGMLGGGAQTQGGPPSDFAAGGRFAPGNPQPSIMAALQAALAGRQAAPAPDPSGWMSIMQRLLAGGR